MTSHKKRRVETGFDKLRDWRRQKKKSNERGKQMPLTMDFEKEKKAERKDTRAAMEAEQQ